MEYKLIQKDRYVYVRPFPDEMLARLIFGACSYKRKNARFMPNPEWGIIKLYDKKKGRFPIGLVYIVAAVIKKKTGIECGIRLKLRELKHEDTDYLRDYQNVAARSMVTGNGGIIQVPTGGGKTRICLSLLNQNPGKKLVLVPTIDLRIQWQKETKNEDITVRTYQSIKSRSFVQSFDIIVFDECHHVAAKTLYKIGMNAREDANIIGLSATPVMRDDDNLKVFAVLGQIMFRVSPRELIKKGFLVPSRVVLVEVTKESSEETLFCSYNDIYNNRILNNVERNKGIVFIAMKEKGRVLILVKLIEHGKILYDLLSRVTDDVIFLNGSCGLEERKNASARIIIATSIYDEGIDIPDLNVLIVAGGGRSDIKTIQRAGRLLRPSPGKSCAIIYDFCDYSKWLLRHSRARELVYKELTDDIERIKISDVL